MIASSALRGNIKTLLAGSLVHDAWQGHTLRLQVATQIVTALTAWLARTPRLLAMATRQTALHVGKADIRVSQE